MRADGTLQPLRAVGVIVGVATLGFRTRTCHGKRRKLGGVINNRSAERARLGRDAVTVGSWVDGFLDSVLRDSSFVASATLCGLWIDVTADLVPS